MSTGFSALDTAQDLLARGWAEAARETVALSGGLHGPDGWRFANLIGKTYLVRDDPENAAAWFSTAQERLPVQAAPESALGIGMNRAMVEVQRGHYDLALRGMGGLEPLLGHCSGPFTAQYWINLAVCQLNLNYFPQALESLERAEMRLPPDGGPMEQAVSVNRGLALAEIDRFEAGRSLLIPALDRAEESDKLHILVELARLDFRRGDPDTGLFWVHLAVQHFWNSWVAFHGVELGYVCEVAGMLARHLGDSSLARRLGERALIRYGQASLWREWRGLSALMEEWSAEEASARSGVGDTAPLRTFLSLIDFMAAQDLVERDASMRSDLRIQVVEAMMEEGDAGPPAAEFVWVSRLADVGLSAMEPDLVSRPDRSPAAWQRYVQHPELSLRLLGDVDLSAGVREGIRDHHETWGGKGFPAGKSGTDIHPWARYFRVADIFARGLTRGLSHTDASQAVRSAEQDRTLDPELGARFQGTVGSLVDHGLVHLL
jgi:tetratricopeptide (TPR) repeat protein